MCRSEYLAFYLTGLLLCVLGQVNKEKEAMIVSMDLEQLQQRLWKGELKALEVLRAYQRKVNALCKP